MRHPPAVDADMPVIDQLARGERCRHQLHAIDDGVEPALQQLDQIVAGVAAAAHRLLIEPAELALAEIGVIALELLLGGELGPEIGRLLAPLAVLAGAVFAAVERALRPTPQIDPEAAVDLVFGFLTLAAHRISGSVSVCCCPDRPPHARARTVGAACPHSRECREHIAAGFAKSNRPFRQQMGMAAPAEAAAMRQRPAINGGSLR